MKFLQFLIFWLMKMCIHVFLILVKDNGNDILSSGIDAFKPSGWKIITKPAVKTQPPPATKETVKMCFFWIQMYLSLYFFYIYDNLSVLRK